MTTRRLPQLRTKDIVRFWGKVNTENGQGPSGTCWEWRNVKDGHGYGMIKLSGKMYRSSRVSYGIYYANDPGDLHILHRCDNPACVNPLHLRAGTASENALDREAKGRGVHFTGEQHGTHTKPETRCYGEKNGSAKISDHHVRAIRKIYKDGGITQTRLAEQFGITQTMVSQIVRRTAWRHI